MPSITWFKLNELEDLGVSGIPSLMSETHRRTSSLVLEFLRIYI